MKREDLTPVRSYKIRGAFNFFRQALAAGNHAELFVCASAGNHAQGFAFVCRHFGKKGVVFMPVTTPQQKIDKTKLFGGEFVEIRLFGDFFDDCYRAALEFAEASGAHMVPPFDHKDIIEGQATVALRYRRPDAGRAGARHHDAAGRRRRAVGGCHALLPRERPRHALRVLRARRRAEPEATASPPGGA